jgi:alpha-D-xyloside xylohydrolase
MPPYWSFGTWLSTGFTDTSQKSVLELARLTRDKKIPADVIHIDCYWLQPSMWCDLEWDLENFPDPAGMLAELHEKGFKTCLWINPYVSVLSPLFKEGDRHGFFLKKSDGSTYVKDMWHGLQPECSIVDFTNKDAAHWFREKLESLLDAGVACFKTDFGEDIPEDTFFSNGLTGEKMRNRYSILYNRTVFETVRDKRGEGLVWGRSGFAGSQKYPVCWSGDPACSFPAMAAVLRGGLSYGLSGVPFWSHDVGGFYGTPNEELYIRWTQFGMFSSHIRCHGTTGREPWRYGPESELIFLKYARLRYSLIPYIHTVAATCCETGEPFIRPLVFHWSKDPTLYSMDDQYMFGPDMLVAPLFSYEKKRPIYLPEGGWFDFHNHQRFQGPAWIVFLAPLDVLPLFVREGAIIPRLMGEASSNLPEKWKGSLYFEQYGKTDRSEVYIFLPDQKWESLPVITLQDTGTLITIQPERGGESHAGS